MWTRTRLFLMARETKIQGVAIYVSLLSWPLSGTKTSSLGLIPSSVNECLLASPVDHEIQGVLYYIQVASSEKTTRVWLLVISKMQTNV